MDQLPRLGKRELICLLSFTCNYVVFVWRGFLFLWVLGMGYVILLWHSLSLPYNYFRLPILNQINISYKNLPGKTFERLESNSKIQIIIDCSFLISQKRANRSKIRIQELSELEFYSRRLTHALYVCS